MVHPLKKYVEPFYFFFKLSFSEMTSKIVSKFKITNVSIAIYILMKFKCSFSSNIKLSIILPFVCDFSI